ncbi:MAG: YbgC/FadM family acyl-CoA thioesterase, partial [Pseudomonadota bacterium]
MSENKGFSWQRRIYYADTDAEGVVYHARYLEFCEQARAELLWHLGYNSEKLKHEYGIAFAVRKAQIDYLAPAHLDDTVTIGVIPTTMTRTRFDMHQEIRNDDKLLCVIDFVMVCINLERFAPQALPEGLRKKI